MKGQEKAPFQRIQWGDLRHNNSNMAVIIAVVLVHDPFSPSLEAIIRLKSQRIVVHFGRQDDKSKKTRDKKKKLLGGKQRKRIEANEK